MLPEIERYLEMIEDLRGQVTAIISDLPPEALNWRPVEGQDEHVTNSLAVLAAHVAGSEHFWIAEVIGQRPATRVRDAEFETQVEDASGLVEKLEKSGAETRTILAELDEADLRATRQAGERIVPVRWAILHVIDHTALHLGHMQLTHQLWLGGRGKPGPRWFERVPPEG